MIIAGIILLLLAYLVPWPVGLLFLATICSILGWILVVIGVILLILGLVRPNAPPIGGRRYWY